MYTSSQSCELYNMPLAISLCSWLGTGVIAVLWERLRKLDFFADFTYTSWLCCIAGMVLAKPSKNKRICLDGMSIVVEQ